MRVLIVNTFYYPKFVGGAEISVQQLAEGLARSGKEVYVLTLGERAAVERVNGVIVIRMTVKNLYSNYNSSGSNALSKMCWHLLDSGNPFTSLFITKLLRRIKPDLVHTNNIQGFSPTIWSAVKKEGIPLVHTFRDYYMLCHRNTLYNNNRKCDRLCAACKVTHAIKKKFADTPDFYVGISRFILNKHKAYFPIEEKRSAVVYNSIEKPGALSPRRMNGKVVLGFIGRVSEDKGAGYLARELLNVGKEFRSHFKVIFAGRGKTEYVAGMQKRLQGIEFEFPGVVKPAGFYQQVDLVIVPSLWDEPFGRVAIESLSHSVPVIMAASGGLSELHNPGCTWLYSPGETNSLSRLIEHVLNNRQEISEKRAACGEHATLFSSQEMVSKYLDIYKKT